eukprot:sb/3464743/
MNYLHPCHVTNPSFQEPTDTSKQPIRTRYLGHVTGYQPIRDQYFLLPSLTSNQQSVKRYDLAAYPNRSALICSACRLIRSTAKRSLIFKWFSEDLKGSQQPINLQQHRWFPLHQELTNTHNINCQIPYGGIRFQGSCPCYNGVTGWSNTSSNPRGNLYELADFGGIIMRVGNSSEMTAYYDISLFFSFSLCLSVSLFLSLSLFPYSSAFSFLSALRIKMDGAIPQFYFDNALRWGRRRQTVTPDQFHEGYATKVISSPPVCEIYLGRCATSISLRLPCSQIRAPFPNLLYRDARGNFARLRNKESVWRRHTPFDSQVRSDDMVSRRHTCQTRPGPALIMILISAPEHWPDPILSRENCGQSIVVGLTDELRGNAVKLVIFTSLDLGGSPHFWRSAESRNRPNQEILVPDWLITSHVTKITSYDWVFTCFGRFLAERLNGAV